MNMQSRFSGLTTLTGRREFIALGVGAFVVGALPLAAMRRRRLVRRSLPIMGTIADFSIVHHDEGLAEDAIDAAFAALTDVDRMMSRFRPDSDIGRANRLASARPVVISAATYAVLEASQKWAEASNGAFDHAIGRVSELWDVAHRHEPPASTDVRQLAARHFYRHVQLGSERGSPAVFFTDADIHLDLGAIAKGYGVDRAAEAMRQRGVRDALVNVGGEIVALGQAPNDEPWHVGIQAPDDARTLLGTIDASDTAIATSGDYEQFFRYRGVRYHHLMDPDTAAPRRTAEHSITTQGESCMDADAASTALFGMTNDETQHVLAVRAHAARIVSLG